jgi:hypothetical protein
MNASGVSRRFGYGRGAQPFGRSRSQRRTNGRVSSFKHRRFPSRVPGKPLSRPARLCRPSARPSSWRAFQGNLTPGKPFLAKLHNLIAAEYQARSADRTPCPRSLFSGAIQPRAGAFADSDAFLFCGGCEDRQDRVTERAATVEVLLCMRPPVDSERVQALKVDERFENALA